MASNGALGDFLKRAHAQKRIVRGAMPLVPPSRVIHRGRRHVQRFIGDRHRER